MLRKKIDKVSNGEEKKGSLKKVSYKCESCGKSFSHAHNLKVHINTVHKGHKDFKCV